MMDGLIVQTEWRGESYRCEIQTPRRHLVSQSNTDAAAAEISALLYFPRKSMGFDCEIDENYCYLTTFHSVEN